jgi:hypothetical protein
LVAATDPELVIATERETKPPFGMLVPKLTLAGAVIVVVGATPVPDTESVLAV